MTRKHLFTVLIASALASCSTYKTSTKTTFDSIQLNGQQPSIHVGEINETPDKIAMLGWVDAAVTQPHWFADKPTEEQVNIILAEKGAKLGADAIIYVSYQTKVNPSTLLQLQGRGQAVKLKDNKALKKYVISSNVTATENTTSITAITPITDTAKPSNTLAVEAVTVLDEGESPSLEQISQIKTNDNKLDRTPVSLSDEVSRKKIEQQLQEQAAIIERNKACTLTLNDLNDYQTMVDSVQFMIKNAEFLVKKSRGIKNGDMESAATRLLFSLRQQLERIEKMKPATP